MEFFEKYNMLKNKRNVSEKVGYYGLFFRT